MEQKEIFTRLLKAVMDSEHKAEAKADTVYQCLDRGQKDFVSRGMLESLFANSDFKDEILDLLGDIVGDRDEISRFVYEIGVHTISVNNVGIEITTDNLYDVITDDEWMAEETKEYLSRPICQRVRPGDTVEVIHKESSIVTGPCTVEGLTVEVGNKNIRVSSGKDRMVITVPFNEETRLFEDDTYLIEERYAAFEKEEKSC